MINYSNATFLLIAVYAMVLVIVAIRGARSTQSAADYALGSTGFSPWVVGLSLAAGITSAATFIINPGFVAYYGWSAFLAMSIVLPIALFGSLVVLTKSFRQYGATVKALTLPQWMAKRYDSPGLGVWFAFLSLLLITFLVLICVGMTKVLTQALGADEWWVLLGLVTFVFGYMMFGGANSMVYTNALQALIMIVVAIMLLGSGIKYFSAGPGAFIDSLKAMDPALTQAFNPKSPLFRDWFEVLFCNFMVGIAIVCQPHIITRSLMLRSDKDVNRFLWVTIVTEIVFFMVLFVGFYARLSFPDMKSNGLAIPLDGVVSAYVVHSFPVVAGLVVILGLLSAGLSTMEGLIQSLSTTITQDLFEKLLPGSAEMTEQAQARRFKSIKALVIVGLAAVTVFWSYAQLQHPNLSVGILAQNGVYAYFSAAFIPVLFGIYGKKVPVYVPAVASTAAIITHFSVYYGGLTPYTDGAIRNPAVAAALAILAAGLSGLVLYFIGRKPRLSQ